MMRRRLVIATTAPQTLRSFVYPQIPALQRAGWSVMVVSSPSGAPEPPAPVGTIVRRIPMARAIDPAADVRALMAWIRLLGRARPDVVMGSTPKAGLLSMTAARATRTPVRVFLHRGARWESERGRRRTLLMELDRLTLAAATHRLAVSRSLAELVVAQGLTPVRPTVLGHGGSKGIDLDYFTPNPARPERPPTLGFLGRLSASKGLETALDAYGELRLRDPLARLRIAGELDPADLPPPEVLTRVQATDGIDWIGRTSDPAAFLRSIDVLVYPSLREGLPNAVIEAAACGVPTVGWKVTGVTDAVDHARTGFLAHPGDATAFIEATVSLALDPPPDIATACRTWAAQFDQDTLTSALVNYLDDIT